MIGHDWLYEPGLTEALYMLYIIYSMAFPTHSGPGLLFSFVVIFTDGRSVPKHRTQIQNKRIHTPNINALRGIRTHDPRVRASEDGSCLRPRGYCDRHMLYIHIFNNM
jgi:hypothetical protein